MGTYLAIRADQPAGGIPPGHGRRGGGKVLVELDGNEIRIRTVREAVARAQALSRRLFADKPNVSVDDFLAHRREDWGEK